MKTYAITGSIGHISRPIIESLLKKGNSVNVITSNPGNAREIESLGAKPFVGSIGDAAFLTKAFRGADAVYTMIPPTWQTEDLRASQNEMGKSYAEAIPKAGVKYVVNLSSVGAHARNGCGPIDGLADFEKMLDAIPALNVKNVRPAYFYYNLLAQIPLIKQAGIMGENFGGPDQKVMMVHTMDIARVIADVLANLDFSGSSVRYVLSDVKTSIEVADTIGKAIGKELKWIVFSDEEQRNGLLRAGVPEALADAYTQMGKAAREGILFEEVVNYSPEPGAIRFEDYMVEFRSAYQ